MKHRAYMRDWYFNAGIVGFLRVIGNDAMPDDLNKIEGLKIEDNYIEFDDELLEGFRDKFVKIAFSQYFDLAYYKNGNKGFIKLKEDIEGARPQTKQFNKDYNVLFTLLKLLYNIDFFNYDKIDNITSTLKRTEDDFNLMDTANIFKRLNKMSEGRSFIESRVRLGLSGMCDVGKANTKYGTGSDLYNLSSVFTHKMELSNSLNSTCNSCQQLKHKIDFNISLTKALGFNSDNSNWIWGFKSVNSKICPLCTLIYYSAPLSFIRQSKQIGKEYREHYYFANVNSNINVLYEENNTIRLKYLKVKDDTNSNSFYDIIINLVSYILNQQTLKTLDEQHFIEMIKSKVGSGYIIHNYRLNKSFAEFINQNPVPNGWYILGKDEFFNISDEILFKMLNHELSYNDLNRYIIYSIDNRIKASIKREYILSFISKYFNYLKGVEQYEG